MLFKVSFFKQYFCGEEQQYTTSAFVFFLKILDLKNKKIINFNYLMIELMKTRLLIVLAFSQYGLVCKYGISIFVFQIEDNRFLLDLSEIETKHKNGTVEGRNHIRQMHREKLKKRNSELAGEKKRVK